METVNTISAPSVFTATMHRNDANTQRPRQLLSELWHEGELAVMFGDSTVGKSLLAVQAAEAISRGNAIKGFTTEAAPQKVLYFDFDNGDRKFAGRYRKHKFSHNFSRVTISKQFFDYHKFGKRMFECMAEMLTETGSRVVIIDSLSTLSYFVTGTFFIAGLLRLKNQFNLSVLVLANTKKSKFGKPLFLGNLAYNKTLAGVADSVFAMSRNVNHKDGRYLIQLKGKESGTVYHENSVITGRNTITPVTGSLPGFEFTGLGTEKHQLLFPPAGLDADILALKQKEPHLSLGEIAQRLKTNKMKVKRALERHPLLREDGRDEGVTPALKSEVLNAKIDKAVPHSSGNPELQNGDTGRPITVDSAASTAVTLTSKFENLNSKPESSGTSKTGKTASVDALPGEAEINQDNGTAFLHSNPFRGDVQPISHPSDPGVKEKPQLSYSQELRRKLNKAARERRK